MDAIKGFFGEYRFLSNFHFADVVYEGITYTTTEAAYQAAKFSDPQLKRQIASYSQPRDAKRAGRQHQMRADWEDVKLAVMYDVTRLKYQHRYLRELLLATGDAYLEETNTWGDQFWGVCNGVGENNLGKILMLIREELRAGK